MTPRQRAERAVDASIVLIIALINDGHSDAAADVRRLARQLCIDELTSSLEPGCDAPDCPHNGELEWCVHCYRMFCPNHIIIDYSESLAHTCSECLGGYDRRMRHGPRRI